jgi:hypothetical protein
MSFHQDGLICRLETKLSNLASDNSESTSRSLQNRFNPRRQQIALAREVLDILVPR